ncbi:MAG: type I-C CRISPR-associated protein Cas8c/Csd1, partial [Gallicola sp.]|nr:type I-C CRISPR-associated protein Cas8c/Csd1 [Gallicola sp.]
MIIQSLTEYYHRKANDPESGIAPEGFENKELQFMIVIDQDGYFSSLQDLREKDGTKLVGKNYLLPKATGRSGSKSYATTFLLWDHVGYVLGLPETEIDTEGNEVPIIKSQLQHETWINHLYSLPSDLKQDEGVSAVIKFYEKNQAEIAKNDPIISDLLKSTSKNISFRLIGEDPIPCRSSVKEFVTENLRVQRLPGDVDVGTCIISGKKGIVARTHTQTPIGRDSKVLVGFQRNSGYDSYGKEQGYNAP